MNNLAMLCLSIAFSASVANASWKTAGECLEDQYFASLYAGESNQDQEIALAGAFMVYEAQAKKGDRDAMLRLASMYEQSSPSKTDQARYWYGEAGSKGNGYALRRFKMLSNKLDANIVRGHEAIDCENFSDLSLVTQGEYLSYVESLAALGQSDCMLALGRQQKEPYWFHRALFTVASKANQGLAAYNLALLQKEPSAWLMATAAQAGLDEAMEWHEEQTRPEVRWQYVSLLNWQNRTDLADYFKNHLMPNSTNTISEFKPVDFKALKSTHQAQLAQAIRLVEETPEQFRLKTLEHIGGHLASESNFEKAESLIDAMLLLGPAKSDNSLNHVVSFLKSDTAKKISDEKRLQLLLEASIGVTASADVIPLAASLVSPKINQIHAALKLRRILAGALDTAELDKALLEARYSYFEVLEAAKTQRIKTFDFHYNDSSDSAELVVLEDILKRTTNLESDDLFMFFFNRLFENEIAQLEYLMRLEDLYFGLKTKSSESSSVFKLAQLLSNLLGPKEQHSNESWVLLAQFPKLARLQSLALGLKDLPFSDNSMLFSHSLSKLESFRSAVANHQVGGFYFWNYGLSATFSSAHIAVIVNELRVRTDSLLRHANEFAQNKMSRWSTVDANFAQRLAAQSVQGALQTKKENLKHYIEELLATQKALDEQLAYDARFTKRQTELKNSEGIEIFRKVPGIAESYKVAVADSQMSPERVPVKDSILFSHKNIRLKKNEILEMRVSGEWSPTCAIRRSEKFSDVQGILIGSEGFRVHFSDGENIVSGSDKRQSTVQFETKSSTHSKGINLAGALGGGLSAAGAALLMVPGAQPAGVALMVVGSVAGAADFSFSKQETSGTTKSTEESSYQQKSHAKSETAAFQSGLRLPHTPFPGLPAGAYIAIVVSEGGAPAILDSFVVQSYRTYIASQDSRIYFVVNDCFDNGSFGSLAVDLQITEPASAHIDRLMSTMQDSLRLFSKKGEALAKEGGDLGSRIETLKTEVIAELEKSSHADFMAEPTVRSVFFHWLAQESDKIVRQARLIDLARQIRITGFEIDDLSQYINLGGTQEAYLATRLGGIVQNANAIPLYESQSAVVDYATKFVLPLLQLYYPDRADGIKKHLSYPAFFSANVQFDFEVAAKEVGLLAEQVLSGLATSELRSINDAQVVVRIPRPGLQLDEHDPDLSMSEGRRRILWDHLFQRGTSEGFGIQLTYADLYEGEGQNKLALTSEAPIIEDMVIGIGVRGSSKVEHLKKRFGGGAIGMEAGREFGFPLAQGPRTFLMMQEGLLNFEVSVGFMNSENSVSDCFHHLQTESSRAFKAAARGLSPFTAFTFGQHKRQLLDRLQSVLGTDDDGYPNSLTEIVIAFKLSSTNQKAIRWLRNRKG